MRFIETTNKVFIAVDTVAQLRDVQDCQMVHMSSSGSKHVLPGKEFDLITKRGETYPVKLYQQDFDMLVRGE